MASSKCTAHDCCAECIYTCALCHELWNAARLGLIMLGDVETKRIPPPPPAEPPKPTSLASYWSEGPRSGIPVQRKAKNTRRTKAAGQSRTPPATPPASLTIDTIDPFHPSIMYASRPTGYSP